MGVIIRQARADDFQYIYGLSRKLAAESKPFLYGLEKQGEFFFYPKEEILHRLKSKDCYVVVAEVDDVIIGCAFARIEKASKWSKYKKQGYLGMLYVEPKYRRKGIAWSLQEERIRWLKSRKIKLLSCTVLTKNEKSLQLQKKRRFIAHSVTMYKEI